jgi:pyridoxine kinase
VIREHVVPHADVLTPNQFELGFLTGTEPDSLASTLESADAARAMGPSTVLVTSVLRPDRPDDTIEMVVVTGAGAWSVRTPRLPIKANGSGDLTAALFTAHLRSTGSPAQALGLTASSVLGVLQATIDSGESELQIVLGQEAIASPAGELVVERVR